MAIQKSELWNLKSEFRNQKSETRIQKSEIPNRNSWKSEIHNWKIRNQKLDFRNATCVIQFWQSRFIPVCNVIISEKIRFISKYFLKEGRKLPPVVEGVRWGFIQNGSNICVNDVEIETKDNSKLLGVVLDSKLNFSEYIISIC